MKADFFERVSFYFDDFSIPNYAVVSYDGASLVLLDEDWNSFTLTRK